MTFEHLPHPRTRAVAAGVHRKVPTVADQHTSGNPAARFNAWLAVKITGGVGTMWCAYLFALLALVSLPDAIKAGRPAVISWIAQTFLQLVLLSIIIVGQTVQAAASDMRAEDTYQDAHAVLHEALQIQAHLQHQDEILEGLGRRRKVVP